jgi:rhodanese-related sulfurtransferase
MSSEVPIEVAPNNVKLLLDQGKIVLIDCRERSEWDVAKIEGAILMPMSNWAEEINQLEKYANRQLVVHCHHGGRSLRVTRWLRDNGFPDAQNMTGGIHAWSQDVDPTVPTY